MFVSGVIRGRGRAGDAGSYRYRIAAAGHTGGKPGRASGSGDGGSQDEYSYFDIDTSPDHAGPADVPSGGGIYGPVGP